MIKKAVLFDIDGVVLDTEGIYASAHEACVRAFGGRLPKGFYRVISGAGRSHEAVRAEFIEASGVCIDSWEYTKKFREICAQSFAAGPVPVVPGALELWEQLTKAGYFCGFVTSSKAEFVKPLLRRTALAPFVGSLGYFVYGDDVLQKKPAPEAYLLALERFGISSRRAVVLEDSQAGISAALGAGLPVVALRHDYNKGQDLSGAARVLPSLADTAAAARAITAALGA